MKLLESKYLENTLTINKDLCIGCRMCLMVCPHGVFQIIDKKVDLAKSELCMECGACQKNCESGAIKVESGVGCAAAMFSKALTKNKNASCGGGCG